MADRDPAPVPAHQGDPADIATTASEPLSPPGVGQELTVRDLQEWIRTMFGAKDAKRGVEGTFMWLMEEVGELSAALRSQNREELELEFADVLAWLVTLANVTQVDLTEVLRKKYGQGCPRCLRDVCACHPANKR